MPGHGQVLQRQGVAVGPAAPAVLEAAGLGAQAPVAAASPDDRGEKALARPAHAQGPVAEHLDLHRGVLADVGDLVPAQLPAQHHPGEAQVGAGLHPVQGVDGHLGGGVEGQVGGDLPEHPGHPQVLDDDGVHPDPAGVGGLFGGPGQLPVGEQGVQGQVDPGPPEMAVRNRRRGLLRGEIFGVAAGVEVPVAQIDAVRPVLYGGGHRLHGAGGGEQFQHGKLASFFSGKPGRRRRPGPSVTSGCSA